jgi:hypothetical protein
MSCQETLRAARLGTQPIPRETAVWLGSIGPTLRDRLARAGLIEAPRQALLGQLLEAYIANRKPTAAANTIKNLEQARRRLLDYFDPDWLTWPAIPGQAAAVRSLPGRIAVALARERLPKVLRRGSPLRLLPEQHASATHFLSRSEN